MLGLYDIHSHFDSYLTVDYERSTFYLSQCLFDPGASEHIIAIPSINSTSTDSPSGNSLSAGAIAGIVIACILVGIWVTIVLLFLFRRRRSQLPEETGSLGNTEQLDLSGKAELDATGKVELDAIETENRGYEIGGTAIDRYELPESSALTTPSPDPVFEMIGDNAKLHELSASAEHHK